MKFNHEKLKELRKERGYNQKIIADALGCKRPNISKIESGAYIKLTQLEKLAQFYDIDISEFFTFDGNEEGFPDLTREAGSSQDELNKKHEDAEKAMNIFKNMCDRLDKENDRLAAKVEELEKQIDDLKATSGSPAARLSP